MAQQQVLSNFELTTMIFQFLKQITQEDDNIQLDDNAIPELNKIWTGRFANLATVNKLFFHATIQVLWEHMDSRMPYLGHLLHAESDSRGRFRGPLVSHLDDGQRPEDTLIGFITLGISRWGPGYRYMDKIQDICAETQDAYLDETYPDQPWLDVMSLDFEGSAGDALPLSGTSISDRH